MNAFKKKFRSIQKLPTWLFWFPATLMKISRYTLFRVTIIDPYNSIAATQSSVAVIWHNRLLMFPVLVPKASRKRVHAMISSSRDGGYIADLIHHFSIKSLRGSSSRRGAQVQREAIEVVRSGRILAMTPDGPRGPKYKLHAGAIHLASMTGVPIIPVMINYSRYWELKSWDRFQIPKPFARVTMTLGELVYIPANLSAEQLESERLKIENILMSMTVDRPTQEKSK